MGGVRRVTHDIEIPITEEFSDPFGRFVNYDLYDDDLRALVQGQRHVDIRSFVFDDSFLVETVGHLSGFDLGTLDVETMSEIEGDTIVVQAGEVWTSASTVAYGADPARNHWNTLRVTLTAGPNVVTSIDDPVDLITGFGDGDHISCALPGFPLPSVTLSSSYLYFSSGPDFSDPNQLAYLSLATTDTTLVNGNCEARWPRSALVAGPDFDPSAVTGVQFRITATAGATFKAAGLRLLAAGWHYLPVDIDTRYQVLRNTVSRTGLTTEAYDASLAPLWRASIPSSEADPRPVDANLAVTFNTGSLTQTNQISVYMRETTKDFETQLDLNGMVQSDLDGKPQPDTGAALWNPRPQSDIDRLTQDDLQGDEQFVLERTPDNLASSYIEFVFQWSSTDGTVLIRNSEGNGYSFLLGGLDANKDYIGIMQLEGTRARAAVYPIDTAGNIDADNLVYDTGWINDDFVLKRRQGRIGWYPQLLDGDVTIDAVRSRGMTFAEQRTLPRVSLTPVEGAQLSAEFSPDRELVRGVGARQGAVVSLDSNHGRDAYQVEVSSLGQGIHTNLITFNNFDQTDLVMKILVPADAVYDGAKLQALLTNDAGRDLSLNLGPLLPGQWNERRIPLSTLGDRIQTGLYRIALVNHANLHYFFWVDQSLSVVERSVQWSARAVVNDPWSSTDEPWLDFASMTNDPRGAVTFPRRGNHLQLRARALRQTAHVGQAKVKPKLAELGRLVFEERPVLEAPTASFVASAPDVDWNVSFDASASSSPNGRVVGHEWSFGDGSSDLGEVTTHYYARVGTYTTALVVIDERGRRSATTDTVVIS